jgi:hypothetical protein
MTENVQHLIVLDDRETFSEFEGCFIVEVPATWDAEQIDDALSGEELTTDMLEWRLNKFEPVEINGGWYIKIG